MTVTFFNRFAIQCRFSIRRSNITGNYVSGGDTIVPYFRAFPPKGTGYHRHVFVLFKQEKKIDLKEFQVMASDPLAKRSFSTLEFYRKFQDDLTPSGLCFFQSDYDKSVQDVFYKTLGRFSQKPTHRIMCNLISLLRNR